RLRRSERSLRTEATCALDSFTKHSSRKASLLLCYKRDANLICARRQCEKALFPIILLHFGLLILPAIAHVSRRMNMARCNWSKSCKHSLAVLSSDTKAEWSNSSVTQFSPNFQAQKWLCAPRSCSAKNI